MAISALGAGLAGMRSAQRALDTSAAGIANNPDLAVQPDSSSVAPTGDGSFSSTLASLSSASGGDLATQIVDQIQSKASFDASAKVVQTASDVLGTLINITA